jgi:hypothetical protein
MKVKRVRQRAAAMLSNATDSRSVAAAGAGF